MGRRRMGSGTGFSLVGLTDTLQEATASLVDALSKQGVDANEDMIFQSLQGLVKNAAYADSSGVDYGNNGLMTASEPKANYSRTADCLAVAHEHYHNGDKKEAIRHCLFAFDIPDSAVLFSAMVEINNHAPDRPDLMANDDPNPADVDESDNDIDPDDMDDKSDDTDNDSEENDDDSDMSDEELDKIISEQEKEDQDSASDDTEDDSGDGDDEDDKDMKTGDKDVDVTANTRPDARNVMARKMSATGSTTDRNRASRLLDAR